MIDIYSKYSDALINLARQISDDCFIIPIGIDGAVVYHLYHSLRRRTGTDFLPNTIQISSKTKKNDNQKLLRLLRYADDERRPVCMIDLRTKTGNLGSAL